MDNFTSRRFNMFLMLLIGIFLGYFLGIVTMNYIANLPAPEVEREYQVQLAGKSLKPDVTPPPQVDPEDVICDCISFVEEDDTELGLLCRCDMPEEGIRWVFEGNAEGLAQLYLYLGDGVKQYYQDLQEKRWPQEGLPDEPDFSEQPFEHQL